MHTATTHAAAEDLSAHGFAREHWVMTQSWRDLLFLHWRWDPDEIQQRLPPGLEVDVFEGRAWIGIVPFVMENIRPFRLPAVRGLSSFPELNLRTYVHDAKGRRGVWFFSLDAHSWLGVKIARNFFHLPYHHANMRVAKVDGGSVRFSSQRRSRKKEPPLVYSWEAPDAGRTAPAGSLECFLCERYRLFAHDARRDRLYCGEVVHSPYLLSRTRVHAWDARLFTLNGFAAPQRAPDHVVASPGVDVGIRPLRRLR
ncbi:MAG: DUF2071 domain-containing protein [Opitutales bacterium]|nr:DUF2071 domain-containing protein [Opitutales bacterium]